LRVLMLAFEFAPLAAGGVYRALGFARNLPACGCELDIVTVRPTDYAAWTTAPTDDALGSDLPDAVRVHRIASGFPSWYWRLTAGPLGFRAAQYLHWGDPVSVFWRRPLLEHLDQLVAVRKPDVLLATVPPFGVGMLARDVARRFRLPWVIDFRDAWSRWCVAPYPSIAHYWYARSAERRVLGEANVAIATSHVTRADWISDHPGLDPARLVTVYNGYDPADASQTPPATDGAAVGRQERERLRDILYVGSFYYTPEARSATFRPVWRRRPQQWLQYRSRREDWLYRSPFFFLRGLRRLHERDPETARRLRVTFVGRVAPWLRGMLDETGTADVVALPGPLAHAEVLRLERSAAAVLLTAAKIEGGRDYSIAGKTYEYFAARTPIIALLTDGAMGDLVRESGLGLFADPDDTDAVASLLQRVASASEPRRLVTANEGFIERFDRRALATELADQLRRAAAEGYRFG
jgi:glycosyltransferase involved in cell wall biosynthesis